MSLFFKKCVFVLQMKFVEKKVLLDGIDKIIIKHLLKEARTPIQILSKACGISGAAIHQRLKKLENTGVVSDLK